MASRVTTAKVSTGRDLQAGPAHSKQHEKDIKTRPVVCFKCDQPQTTCRFVYVRLNGTF